MDENSTLTLSCRRFITPPTDICEVMVKDNGVGMPPETLAQLRRVLDEHSGLKGSIGLKNIATRMSLLYGDAFTFSIESTEGKGSSFILRFPFIS